MSEIMMAAAVHDPAKDGPKDVKVILPLTGHEIWELGLQENWGFLGKWLNISGVEALFVVDPSTEAHLAQYRYLIDTSTKAGTRGRTLLGCLVDPRNVERGNTLLKRVLALGADPNVQDNCAGRRILFVAVENNQFKNAETLLLCRASVAGRFSSGKTIMEVVKEKESAHVPGAGQFRKLLERIQKNKDYPTIAELMASKSGYWAVANRCRRRVVVGAEAAEKIQGRDAIEWARKDGAMELVAELRYLLHGVPTSGKSTRPSPTNELLLKIPGRVAPTSVATPESPSEAEGSQIDTNEIVDAKSRPAKSQAPNKAEGDHTSSDALVQQLQAIKNGIGQSSDKIVKELEAIHCDVEIETKEREKAVARLEKLHRAHEEKFEQIQRHFDGLHPQLKRMEETFASGNLAAVSSNAKSLLQTGANPVQVVIFDLLKNIAQVAARHPSYELLGDLLRVQEKHTIQAAREE